MILVEESEEFLMLYCRAYIHVRPICQICQASNQLDNWGGGGGHIFIYSCSAQLVSFEINCFYGL